MYNSIKGKATKHNNIRPRLKCTSSGLVKFNWILCSFIPNYDSQMGSKSQVWLLFHATKHTRGLVAGKVPLWLIHGAVGADTSSHNQTSSSVAAALMTRKWPFHLLTPYVYSYDVFVVCWRVSTMFVQPNSSPTNTWAVFYCNNTFYALWLDAGPVTPPPH